MKTKRAGRCPGAGIAFLFLGLTLVASRPVRAADFFWTNAGNAGNFTNAAIWATNGVALNTVPGATDNANFTNQISPTVHWTADTTTSNAFFNAPGGTVLLNISNQTWSVLNSVVVGQNAGATASVAMISGRWIVTNATRTGSLILGKAGGGGGTLILSNGTILADSLVATNAAFSEASSLIMRGGALTVNNLNLLASATNGAVNFQGGVLTTLGNSTIADGGKGIQLASMATPSQQFVWNIVGGTNLVTLSGNNSFLINYAQSGSTGIVNVTGAGTVLTNSIPGSGAMSIGYQAPYNQLNVSSGAAVYVNGPFNIGAGNVKGSNNTVLVTGSNSSLSVSKAFTVGNVGPGNALTIADGGSVSSGGALALGSGNASGSNNTILVTGANSRLLSLSSFTVGSLGQSNLLTIADGGSVWASSMTIGESASSTNNAVLITNGSLTVSGVLDARRGNVTVNHGGTLVADKLYATNGSTVFLSGGTLLEASTLVAGGAGSGSISNAGGVLQFASGAPTITAYSAGALSLNSGTIAFRGVTNADVMGSLGSNALANLLFIGNNAFRLNNASNTYAASPQNYTFASGISPSNYTRLELVNGGTAWKSAWLNIGSGGSLLISNTAATIAGVLTNSGQILVSGASATWQSNVVLNGGSSYRSHDATNTFANGAVVASGASFVADAASLVTILGNYQNLGASVFSNRFTVGSGGLYQASGATNAFVGGLFVASGGGFLAQGGGTTVVDGVITNAGMIGVTNGTVIFQNAVVNLSAYASDPSTNTFNGVFTVGPTGVVHAAAGDVYAFGTDFVMQSTNRAFDMSLARVVFATNGYGLATTSANHALHLTSSGAVDMGSNWLDAAQLATNFSMGTLTIAMNNNLTLLGSKGGGVTNALYVGWLDIQDAEGFDATSNYDGLTNALFAALTLPNINLYYEKFNPGNTYLGGLEYNLWGGGGLLIPIPEPSVALAVAVGLGMLAFVRRRRA